MTFKLCVALIAWGMVVSVVQLLASADQYTVTARTNNGISSTSAASTFVNPLVVWRDINSNNQGQARVYDDEVLDPLPDMHVVLEAYLIVNGQPGHTPKGHFGVWQITQIFEQDPLNWNEQTIAGSNGWICTAMGGELDVTPIQSPQQANTLDITRAVQNWAHDGQENLGVALKGYAGCSHRIKNSGGAVPDRPEFVIVHELFGDSNKDGEFGSQDLVQVFVAGLYETGQAATFEEGDWNLDGVFDSGDFVDAGVLGHYEGGVAAMVADWEELE